MQICSNFLQCIEEDLPTVKLFKYRHFLSTYQQIAMQVFDKMCDYALEKNLVGQYQAIHETIKRDMIKVGKYKDLRQQMVDFTNPLRNQTQHAQSISSLEDMANGYFKLAQYYKKIGMHREATNYYSRLFRCQSGNKIIYQRSQYFTAWAQELWLDNNWEELNIFIRNDLEDPKKVDCTLALVQDLKYIQLGQSSSKFFETVLGTNYPINEVTSNSVISFIDLGTIYSLVALAKKDRQFLKIKTLWSGKLEVLYLQNNFKGLLDKIHNMYEKEGKFHPLIDKIYNDLFRRIRQRVLKKYLSVYSSISLKEIKQNTTYSQGQIKMFIQNNPQQPYLIDPVTQSVIHYEKNLPLYNQALVYGQMIKQKFRQKIRNCLHARKAQQMDMSGASILGRLGITGSGSPFRQSGSRSRGGPLGNFGFDFS